MIPVIMNTRFERLGVIDDYVSFIWTTRYYTTGDFELCVDVSNDKTQYLVKDYYILREDDDNVGIINKINKAKNEDGKEMLIVSGRFLSSILARRIIAQQTQLNTTVSSGVYTLVINEAIAPVDENRRIPNLLYGHFEKTDRLVAQYTGDNLLDTIEKICETYGIGHKTTLTEQNEFKFQLYEGVDRSYNQTTNPYVVFSDEYDNLISSEYSENYGEMVTNVLVAGEGEGLDRKTLWVGSDETGLNRHEKYVDQRQLSTNDGEVSDDEYNEQMKEAGLENITSFTNTFSGEVYFDNIEYKKNVYVGDICVIENTNWGIYMNTRLVEVIESVDETGQYTIVPTFGI